MRVLITGAAGFFGRALVREFVLAGDDVLAADILSPDAFAPRADTPGAAQVEYMRLNVANEEDWAAPTLAGVEAIVHAAALTPTVEETKHDPSRLIDVNLTGTLYALEFARKGGLEKFLFISSGGVYDQFDEVVLKEEDADGGFSLYGSAKLAAEILAFRYSKMFEFDAGAVRPTSMYGPAEEFRDTRPFVTEIKLLSDATRAGDPIRVERPESRCDWVYVDDVASCTRRFFEMGMGGRVFNLSSGNPRHFKDVVEAAQAAFGLKVEDDADRVIDGGPDRPTVISSTKAEQELGWSPDAVEDGLRRYAEAIGL
jgi:UDP-glucose 4-epimerase